MDTVYTVAPVFNVNPGGEATSAGGFIGSIETGKSVTVAASEGESTIFYLPSIYENNIDDNAPYLGNGASDNQLSMDINILHFYVDADGNIISAKGNEETMQKRTFPYDGRLKDTGVQSSKEYPFSVWSTFGFNDNNYRVNNTYYGDWQSIVNEPTETCAIEFYMINPLTGAESKIIDPNLPDQIIIKGQENTVLLPYTNMIPGYYIANWTVKKTDNTDSTPIESTDGTLTIPNSLCGTAGDTTTVIKVTAHYLEDKSNLYVTFFYDPSGENTDFEQIGDTKIIKPIPATLYNQIDTPSKEIESYKFIGWFNYDPETGYGTEIDFTSASSIKSNINAYAKYELIKTYTVTIDFMYSLDGGASRYLSSLPRYRLEEVGQYKLNFTEGDIFTGDIPLPDVTFEEGVKLNDITLGKYVLNEETGNVDIVEDLDHARLVDEVIKLSNLNTDCRFVVTYDLDTGEAEETYVYKLIYRYYNTNAETETIWEVATDNYGSQYREKDFDTELTFKRGKWWYETLEDVTKTGKNTDLYKVVAHDRTSPDQYYVFDNGMQLTSGNAKYIQDAWYLVNDTDALYEKYTGTTTGTYFYQDGNEIKSKTLSYDSNEKKWYDLFASEVYYEANKSGSSSGTYYIFNNGNMNANTQKVTYVSDGWYVSGTGDLYQKYTGSTSGMYYFLYNGRMIKSTSNLTKESDGWYIKVNNASTNNVTFYNKAHDNNTDWDTGWDRERYYFATENGIENHNTYWRCEDGVIQYLSGMQWTSLDGVAEIYSSNNNGSFIYNDDLDEFIVVSKSNQNKNYSYSKFVATDVYRKDGDGVNIAVNGDCYVQDGNNMIAVKKSGNRQYKSDKKADTIYYKASGAAVAGRKYYRLEDGKLIETPYAGDGQSKNYVTSTVYRKDGVSANIAVNAKCYIFKNGSFVEVVKADTNQYKGNKVANEIYEKDTGSSDIGSTRYIEIIDGFTGDVTLQEVTKTGQKAYEYTTQELVEKEYTGTRYKQNTSYQMHYDANNVLETDLGNYLMKINTEPAFNLIPVTGFTIKDRIIKVEKPGTTEEPWREEWNSADVVYIIEYERNKYTLSFKSKLGIFADGFENPVSLYFDQPLNSVPHGSNVITRKYYTFDTTKEGSADGWMITNLGNAEPEFTDYTWADRMPYNNLVAYPQWKTNDTANYKIIVWRQKITDDRQLNKDGDNANKSYDFVFMDSKSGAVGSSVNIDSYKNYSSSDYDGFQYSWTDAGTKTISADNTTVINVYYDRKIVTYEFYTDSNYSNPWSDAVYTESTSEEAKYGVVNGEYIELTRKEDGWYYTEAYKAEVETTAEYNGDRYEIITSGYRTNTTYYYNNNGTLSVAYYSYGNWYNANWRQISTPSAIYRRTNPTTGTIYGWDSNEKKFVQLTKSGNKYTYVITVEETRYREAKYTGKRYTYGGGQASPFWGLYGQLLTQYGYQWPSNYKWYYRSSSGNSAGMSYLGQFLSGSDYYGYQQNKIMMRVDNSDGVRYIYFYQQGLDGNYPDTPTDIGAITGGSSGFNFTEKYGNGFHHVQYKINNGSWKSTSSEMGGSDFKTNNILHIRYERNKFEIQYYPVVVNGSSYDVASTPVAKVSAYYDSTIEKNDSLIPEQPSDETYRAQGYAWNGKYYEDQACTVEYSFGNKMPAANVPVYVKYVLPEVNIHFNLIDENATIKPSDAKYAEAGETEDYTITVTKQDSIEGLITLDDELLPKYSPVTESGEYDFVKWYYYSNGSKKEFYYTQEITEDIELYAEWKIHEDEPEVENINVVVSYMYVDGDGIEHKIATDTGPIKRAAGTYYIMVCPDIDEYYPKDTICSFPVTKTPSAISNSTYDPETNTLNVKAYYNRVQEWKYQVNLYARYSNYIDDEVPGLTKATSPSEYLIETYLASAYSLYDSVEFVMPSEYSNYHLVEYEYDGNTGSDTVVTIHQDPYLTGTEYKAVINYYIEPDPSLITVDNIDTIYDGTEKANSAPRLDEKNVYRAPNDDTTVTTYDIYTYLNGEGVAISAIDSGSYSASGYVYITVNGNNYLLWKSNKDQLSLRIAKRNVLAISQDLEGYYDANSTLTNDVVDDTTKNDLYQGFVEGEGANYNFSIESFRKDPGSTKNNFDFEFWKKDESLGHKETKAQNYNVIVKFGTLSIYWDYDIESYVVFDNISLEDEEKILLDQFITLADESTYKIDERNDIRARKYDATVDYSFLDGAKYDSYLFDHGTYDGNTETEMRSTVYPYLIGDIYTGKLGLYMKLNTNTENFMIRDASVKPLTPQKQIIANFAYADPLYEEESTEHGVEIVTVMDATDNPVSENIYKNVNNTIHVPELADIKETITEEVVIDDTTEPATTEPVTYEVTFEVKYWTVEGDSNNYKFVPDEDGNIVVDAALCAGNVDDETESIKLIAHYGLAEDRTPIDKHVPENEGITVFEVASSYVLPDAPEGTTVCFTYCYIPYIKQADDTFIPVPKEMLYSESEEDYAADAFLIMKVDDGSSAKNYIVRKNTSKDIKLKLELQTESGE